MRRGWADQPLPINNAEAGSGWFTSSFWFEHNITSRILETITDGWKDSL
jgi:hypothetical protein